MEVSNPPLFPITMTDTSGGSAQEAKITFGKQNVARGWIRRIGGCYVDYSCEKLQIACPFCSNRRISITNSLLSHYPTLAAEFDVVENGGLQASKVCMFQPIMSRFYIQAENHMFGSVNTTTITG